MSRGGETPVLGFLQKYRHLLSGDGGEILEKLSQWVSAFEVLKQRPDRDTRAGEARRSPPSLPDQPKSPTPSCSQFIPMHQNAN